jgi:NADH:ubiquinone oxidoreductase subunit 4 (subunit M)
MSNAVAVVDHNDPLSLVPNARARVLRAVAAVALLVLWLPVDRVVTAMAWLGIVGWAMVASRRVPWLLVLPTIAAGVLLGLPDAPMWLLAVSVAVVAGVVPAHLWMEQLRRRLPPSDFMVFAVAQPGVALAIRALSHSALHHSEQAIEVLTVVCVVSAVLQAGLALVRTSASRSVVAVAWSQGSLLLAGALGAEAGDAAAVMMAIGCGAGTLALLSAIEQLRRRFNVTELAPDNGLALLAPTTGAVLLVMGWLFVGLPGGVTFVAEDLLFHELFEHQPVLTIVFIFASSMNAIAFYKVYTGLFGGVPRPEVVKAAQPCSPLVTALLVLTGIVLVCGVVPQLVLHAL